MPPLTVRLHGRRIVEEFLWRLYEVAKAEYPEGLVTYANFPPTEYLELDFLDFHTLNVCNYNGAATLAETLDSLVALDYPDFEVLYVDDGSTDRSLAIAREFEPSVRIIAQENQLLSAARNVGAEAATGEIVA